MHQKFCSTCLKPLTTTERSLDEIQCANCYQHWLNVVLPGHEPYVRALLQKIRENESAPALPAGRCLPSPRSPH